MSALKKKPHAAPFPRVDRVDDLKAGYRKKQEEERAAAERLAIMRARAEEEEQRRLEEEHKRLEAEEEKKKQAEVERKAKRPWKTASYVPETAPEKIELKEIKEEKDDRKKSKDGPDVEQSLEAIYMEKGDEIPDLSKLERGRSKRWLQMTFGFLFSVATLASSAFAGFYFFQPFRQFSGEGLRLSIQGPEAIALGREETFVVAWTNRDDKSIDRADIRIGLPEDFTVTSMEPSASDKSLTLWHLGYLRGREAGTIRVKGIFTGALGTQSAIQAIGTYRPWSYTRDVDVVATQALLYRDTVLSATLSAPSKVIAGDSVSVKYAVANNGTEAMSGLVAKFRYPQGFVPTPGSSSTAVDASRTEVEIPLPPIAAHATTTVALDGTFVSGSSGDMSFHAETGRKSSDRAFLPAQKSDVHVPVLAGDLTLRFVANGSNADRSLLPGEPVRIAIAYENTSPESIKDAAITLSFESFVDGKSATGTSLLDWKQLDDALAGTSSTKPRVQTIRYDKKQIPAFANLAPQSEGTIEVTLPSVAVASGTKDGSILLTVQGNVPVVGGTKVNRTVRAQPITLRYRSDADLAVEARYYTEEGAPVGFGPLPPVAGKTTAYRIGWKIEKSLHALQNVTVSAVLPKIAAWSARTLEEAGTVTYDEATRTVTWSLNEMPEGTRALEVAFEVQLTPEQVDIGRFAALLGETKFQATDPITGESIVRAKPALSTDLQSDEGARGKGVVKKE